MPLTEDPITASRFKYGFGPSPEVDPAGKISIAEAFEMAKQVGDERAAFWLGLNIVRNLSRAMTVGDKQSQAGIHIFRSLLLAVQALGERELAKGADKETPLAVQYLRDVAARHSGMSDAQSDDILAALA